jgi:hypothetical protein
VYGALYVEGQGPTVCKEIRFGKANLYKKSHISDVIEIRALLVHKTKGTDSGNRDYVPHIL